MLARCVSISIFLYSYKEHDLFCQRMVELNFFNEEKIRAFLVRPLLLICMHGRLATTNLHSLMTKKKSM